MSALLEQFKEAVCRKDWKTAYRHCNGLNMYEMLRGLDSIDRSDLETLSKGILAESESGATNTPRIAYAINVVLNRILPDIVPGDLRETGQVADAENFLKEKKVRKQGPKFGHNGNIPSEYIAKLNQAFGSLWKLNDKPGFAEKFRSTVEECTKKQAASDIYETTLNSLILHLADTSTNPKGLDPFNEDNNLIAEGRIPAVGMAYTHVGEPNIWIRKSSLGRDERTIVAVLIHEAMHTVGVTDWNAEAIDKVNNAAGYPKPTVK